MLRFKYGTILVVFSLFFSAVTVVTAAQPAEEKRLGEKSTLRVSSHEVKALHKYAKKHGYSTRYGLFANLGLNSGLKRLAVVDLQTHLIVESALVTHGHCKENESEVRFSNIEGSNCSSTGRYRIGKSYYGSFGLAFKLHGLDKTNNNAFSRAIVMHAHECVYDTVWPVEICESEGCPTVSPQMLRNIQKLIQSETSPLLLWLYKKG